MPLGRNLSETKELAKTARSANAHVAIGLQTRVNPALIRARTGKFWRQGGLCRAQCPSRFLYRKRVADAAPAPAVKAASARALAPAERESVLACLHEERFQNASPAAVYATLLDEGSYYCSIRTIYRILATEGESLERRDQRVHPAYRKPELLATGPNQLWSWDITKLLGPAKWTYFYLYVILDVFRRYVVGWMVADGENAELAKRSIADTCGKQSIEPGQLTISRRPGIFDDLETGRIPDGRHGDHQNPRSSPCLRRQPLFGKSVPNSEIPARLPRKVRLAARISAVLHLTVTPRLRSTCRKSYQAHLEWTPSRLIHWAETVGEATEHVVQKVLAKKPHPEMGYRACMGIISLGRTYSNPRLEAASKRALELGACSYQSLKSILQRSLDRQTTLPLEPERTGPSHENVRGAHYYDPPTTLLQ